MPKQTSTLESSLIKINEVKPQPLTETPKQIVQPTQVQSKAPTPQPKQEYKPMPKEIQIITEAFEEFEGILYAARNKIYQIYGPVDYQAQNSTKPRNLEDIRMSFPEEIEATITFVEQDDKFILLLKQRVAPETFAKIASAVRGMGGQYISAGKDSRFEIRKF